MKKTTLEKILTETEAGYDQMADKFSGTRTFFWRDLEFIKDQINSKSKILDFGCGNGRLLEILKAKNIDYYGTDISQKLIDLARQKYPDFAAHIYKNSGAAKLDFPDNFFDVIVSIAVFHHFPSEKYRTEIANELYRIVKPDGKVIVTVWNLWQKKYRKYIWQNFSKKLIGQSKLDFLDCQIPFKNNAGEIFTRFHHVYTLRELKNIFSQAGFREIEVKVVNNKNLVLIGKK